MLPVREIRFHEAVEIALDRLPRLGLLRRVARQLREDLARFRPREDGPRLERLEVAREALHRGVPHLAKRVGRKVAERLVHRASLRDQRKASTRTVAAFGSGKRAEFVETSEPQLFGA